MILLANNNSMNSGILATIAGVEICANALVRRRAERNSRRITVPTRLHYIHNNSSIGGFRERRAQVRLQFSYVKFCWNIQEEFKLLFSCIDPRALQPTAARY